MVELLQGMTPSGGYTGPRDTALLPFGHRGILIFQTLGPNQGGQKVGGR